MDFLAARRSIYSMATDDHPRLALGTEAEWTQFNEEKARPERELIERLSVEERLEFGQRLSQFRAKLLAEFRARHDLD